MSGLSLSGVSSGMDWASLIDGLVAIEGNKRTLVVQRKTDTQTQVAALQGLNVGLALLANAAKAAAKETSWGAVKATTTSYASATPTVREGAQPGSVTFSVDQVATTQRSVSATVSEGAQLLGGTGALTIVRSDGTHVQITPTDDSLGAIVKAVNDNPDSGVRATLIKVAPDGGVDDGPQYRVQFTSTATGQDAAFAVHQGTPPDLGARLDTVNRTADNARITLFGDTVLEQSSNTFTDIIEGLDFTVEATSDEVTIQVETDTAALVGLAKDMVTTLNAVLEDIATRTRPTTNASGGVSGGVLAGESVVRSAQQAIMSALSLPVLGASPSQFGIEITRDGTFKFDEEMFTNVLADNPDRLAAGVQALAARLEDAANAYSDKYDGLLTRRINSHEELIRTYDDQIEAWNLRLQARRETLTAKFVAMETQLARLEGMSSWLSSQFDAMTASKKS